mmetsp:Transcript_9386/g.26794  ORF Transcript_9386/g.26794 Transcript_9386/m.26794 type:complete len:201 (-) Transcript_9386:1443-2045(-)
MARGASAPCFRTNTAASFHLLERLQVLLSLGTEGSPRHQLLRPLSNGGCQCHKFVMILHWNVEQDWIERPHPVSWDLAAQLTVNHGESVEGVQQISVCPQLHAAAVQPVRAALPHMAGVPLPQSLRLLLLAVRRCGLAGRPDHVTRPGFLATSPGLCADVNPHRAHKLRDGPPIGPVSLTRCAGGTGSQSLLWNEAPASG